MTENKRFSETWSTGIVTDNVTGKEYQCEMRIDDDLLEVMNNLHEENQRLKHTLEKKDELLRDVLKVNDNMMKRVRELEDDKR